MMDAQPREMAKAVALQTKSTKRGMAYGGDSVADLTVLSKGIGWWYNWSPTPEAAVKNSYQSLGVAFVPMVWGGTPTATQIAAEIPAGSQYLLGFNEPNFTSQANMTPSHAASLWPVLESVAQTKNLQLGAPAVNYCGGCVSEGGVTYSDPVAYLDAFFADCKNCKVDFIPVHWYACDVSALEWYIGRFKKYAKPIWLTEFACGDMAHNQITLAIQKNYMAAAVNYLENEPAVARYSWFSGRNSQIPYINLLGADGQLTELGQYYVSLPYSSATSATVLTPRAAVASSAEQTALGAAQAIDNNLTTRWSSAFTDQQWIYLDYGSTAHFSSITINWENAHATAYQIQTSNDALNWTTILDVTASKGGTENLALSGSGRYLRMNGVKRATPYGYSIFELHAWGNMAGAAAVGAVNTASNGQRPPTRAQHLPTRPSA